MSYTPRTDKVTWHFNDPKKDVVSTDFARELERELAEAQQTIVRLRMDKGHIDTLALRERDALLADRDRLDWLALKCYLPDENQRPPSTESVYAVVNEKVAPLGSFNCDPANDAKAFRAAIDTVMRPAQPPAP